MLVRGSQLNSNNYTRRVTLELGGNNAAAPRRGIKGCSPYAREDDLPIQLAPWTLPLASSWDLLEKDGRPV